MHSISTSVLRGSVLTATHVRHGFTSPQYSLYTSFTAAKSSCEVISDPSRAHRRITHHVRQEDVNLDDVVQARASLLEDRAQVLDALVLEACQPSSPNQTHPTHRVRLHIAVDQLARLRVHRDRARAVHHPARLDRLGVDARERGRRVQSQDGFLGHCVEV